MHFSAALPPKLKHRKNPNKQEENSKFYVGNVFMMCNFTHRFLVFLVNFPLFRLKYFGHGKLTLTTDTSHVYTFPSISTFSFVCLASSRNRNKIFDQK